MEIHETNLDGVVEIRAKRSGDDRGWFSETYKELALRDAGININFVQDNESFSASTGTLRGLHYQTTPHAQDKVIRVISGSILDVAVDIRRDSTLIRPARRRYALPPTTVTSSSFPLALPTASARLNPTLVSPTK